MIQPKPSLARPYQLRAIERMVCLKRVLLADPPGAGKSLMVLGTLNQLSVFDNLNVLIICPASIKFVWETEIEKWCIPNSRVDVISGSTGKKGTSRTFAGNDPDQDVTCHQINFTIVNYDICIRPPVRRTLMKQKYDVIVCDECHMLKSMTSKRSKVCLGVDDRTTPLISRAQRIIAITGTPLNNHVVDLWPIVRTLAPEEFGTNFDRFAMRYCDPRPTDYGMDYTGADNLLELNQKLRDTCMIRRKKEIILPEIPEKSFSTIMIEGAGSLIKQEERILSDANALDLKKSYDGIEPEQMLIDTMSTVRKELSIEKLKYTYPMIKNWLESCNEKLVIMGYHTEALYELHKRLLPFGAVILTGKTSSKGRQEAVESFQNKPNTRVFIGNIKAAGVGLTLTSARTIFFVELDWNPSSMLQAVDRVHRIGQTKKVQVQFLCFRNSLEASIAKSLEKKSHRIDTAIDTGSEDSARHDMRELD